MLRLALLTTDNREDRKDYSSEVPWFGTAPQALLDGFSHIPEQIEVHVVSCTRRHLKTPLQLARNIVFHSVYVPPWAWLKVAYLGNILSVRRCLSGIHPDLVHGQGTERDCAWTSVFSGYPNLLTIHGNMRRLASISNAPFWSFTGLSALLEAIAIRLSGGVICLSSHSHQLVESSAKRTWLVPNAVDASFFSIQRSPSATPPLILVVADLLPNKNILQFLQSLTELRSSHPFKVRLIGKAEQDSPYVRSIQSFAAQHSWCEIEPFADRQRIRAEMASATLLALPSLEENLPMVILEAMAAGLPVAASRVGGIPDLITDKLTGMLFDPLCADSIRAAIRHLLDHPANREEMAATARMKTRSSHHPENIANAHLDIYRRMLPIKA
jgi:glycosyltransferase involved in cell wall biosynthesis